MHEKCFKIILFANFRKLQKNLPFGGKTYINIQKTSGTVVNVVKILQNGTPEKKKVSSNVSLAVNF